MWRLLEPTLALQKQNLVKWGPGIFMITSSPGKPDIWAHMQGRIESINTDGPARRGPVCQVIQRMLKNHHCQKEPPPPASSDVWNSFVRHSASNMSLVKLWRRVVCRGILACTRLTLQSTHLLFPDQHELFPEDTGSRHAPHLTIVRRPLPSAVILTGYGNDLHTGHQWLFSFLGL